MQEYGLTIPPPKEQDKGMSLRQNLDTYDWEL